MELTRNDYAMAGIDYPEMLAGLDKATSDAIKKIQAMNAGASKRRMHFIERLQDMDSAIIEGLLSGRLQLSDAVLYGTRSVGAADSVAVFRENDSKAYGFCSLEKAKLDPNRPLVLSSISLGYHGGASEITSANVNTFANIAYTAEILNAEWKLRYDSKDIYEEMPVGLTFAPGLHPSSTSVPAITQGTGAGLQAAYTQNPNFGYSSGLPYGQYNLDNPKLLKGGKRIEFELKMAAALGTGTYAAHAFKVALIGTTVRPN